MVIYIGADHRGFELKKQIKNDLQLAGYSVVDLGNGVYDEDDDYTDFAEKVASKISLESETSRGIVICGSGVGADVTANKFKNVRCALVGNSDQAFDSRNDDNSNILALGANYLDIDDAKKIIVTWLETPFSGEERHKRRLDKISELEVKLIRDVSTLDKKNDYQY